jgi:hypothetical protein
MNQLVQLLDPESEEAADREWSVLVGAWNL